jgi:hypothetical protein
MRQIGANHYPYRPGDFFILDKRGECTQVIRKADFDETQYDLVEPEASEEE